MNEQLKAIQQRLAEAKKQRGRLTEIAAGAGITYRTVYSVMKADASPAALTLDKLTAYFKKVDRRAAK